MTFSVDPSLNRPRSQEKSDVKREQAWAEDLLSVRLWDLGPVFEEDTELRLVHDCVSQVIKLREISVQEGSLRWGCGGDRGHRALGNNRSG